MDNATTILFEEKQRLENCVALARERFLQVSAPAMVQRSQKNPLTGEDVMVSYIELDRFTPEQREQFDIHTKRVEEHRARLCVFDNFVKGMTPQATVQSYNQHVSPLEEYKNVSVSCNCVDLDEKGEFTKYSIKVGSTLVESPESMTFDEYRQLYTSNLGSLLLRSLEGGLNQEEAMQQLQNACAEVYLQQEKKSSMSL